MESAAGNRPELTALPNLLALHQYAPERYPFLLESVTGAVGRTSRYSLLLGFPGNRLELNQRGLFSNGQRQSETGFLSALDRDLAAAPLTATAAQLPFNGGWFVYLGYELAGQIEPSLRLPPAGSQLPIALAVRCPAAVIVDHQDASYHLVAEADCAQRDRLLQQMQADIDALQSLAPASTQPIILTACREEPEVQFLHSIARIKDYLLAGDIFQVNLSRLWTLETEHEVDPAQLYQRLREANPAPFAGLFRYQDTAVVSSSPERLVSVRGRQVQTRPIAGTRKRQTGAERQDGADRMERDRLIRHPKERAEHIMLIDLERNDLGRVCQPGSVVVDELLGLESYTHVHHIVSNVSGVLREDCSPVDALRAVFPGGTITGCPKVHCMEIIAELEGEGRGPYTGAMGYLDRNGNMDMNILIRSLETQNNHIRFRAGAGIVADSDPQAELLETRAKAAGLLAAFEPEA